MLWRAARAASSLATLHPVRLVTTVTTVPGGSTCAYAVVRHAPSSAPLAAASLGAVPAAACPMLASLRL